MARFRGLVSDKVVTGYSLRRSLLSSASLCTVQLSAEYVLWYVSCAVDAREKRSRPTAKLNDMYAGWSRHHMPGPAQQLLANSSLSTCGCIAIRCKVSCGQTRKGARRHSRLSAVAANQQALQAATTPIQQTSESGDWFFSQRGQQDWVSNPIILLHQPGLVH